MLLDVETLFLRLQNVAGSCSRYLRVRALPCLSFMPARRIKIVQVYGDQFVAYPLYTKTLAWLPLNQNVWKCQPLMVGSNGRNEVAH